MIPVEAVSVILLLLALACQRWWHWKREAYRTRDAAFESFDLIKAAALREATE